MSWWGVLPGIVLLAALWVVPGYALLRALGVRGLLAWGAGGAVTTATAGIFGVVFDWVGIGWSLWTFLAGWLVALAGAVILGRLLGTVNSPEGIRLTGDRRSWADRSWLIATWGVSGLALTLPQMLGMSRPDMPLQAWDAVFHYNAAWTIADTGEASLIGGLSPMYGDTIAPYYPSVWHSIVAIAPGFPGVTEAANASTLVIGAVLWIAGLVALARVVWQDEKHRHGWLPVVLTPILAATYVGFPTVAMTMLGTWPFALSTACIPGALALTIVALRGNQSWQFHLVHGIGAVVSALGVVVAHGSGLFSLALLAAPLALVMLIKQARRAIEAGYLWPVVGAAAALTAAGVYGIMWLLDFPPLQAVVEYERGGGENYLGPIGSIISDQPLIYAYDFVSLNLIGLLLVIAGIFAVFQLRRARWLVLAWLAAAVMVALAAGPMDNRFRPLAGFWYTQPSRIYQVLLIPAIMLAVGGAAALVRYLAAPERRGIGAQIGYSVLIVLGLTAPVLVGFGIIGSDEERDISEVIPAVAFVLVLVKVATVLLVLGLRYASERVKWGQFKIALPAATIAVVVVLAISTSMFRWPTNLMVTQSIYNNWPIAWGTMLEREEIDMVDRAADTLPDDAIVLGEPVNGSSYLLARSDVQVVYRHLSPVHDSPERMLLMERFHLWRSDPAVCEAVRDLGVTHVYTDTLTFDEGAKWESDTPGLRHAQPTDDGSFELVDEGGKASLWRFTGCDA